MPRSRWRRLRSSPLKVEPRDLPHCRATGTATRLIGIRKIGAGWNHSG
jgi:hypothetical protein